MIGLQVLCTHDDDDDIGVATGCRGCTCTPGRWKKIFRRNLPGKFVSALCTPGHEVHPGQSKSQILGYFLLGVLDLEVYLVVLDRL